MVTPMRVFVTGASGFVGSHLVPKLLEAGHEVRAMARGARPNRLPAEVSFVRGSVTDPAAIRDALDGVDAVVHLVAIIIERGAQTFDAVNVGATQTLVREMERAGVRRLVHLSALGAGPDPGYPYLRSKWQGEETVRASGLDQTILRPSALHGRGAGFYRPIVWTLRWMPFYPLPRGGKTRFQPLWIDDLSRCVLACLDGAAVGETLDLGGPEIQDFRAMAESTARFLGKKRWFVSVPLWAARPFAYIQERMKEPLVTNQQLDMVVLDNVASPTSVRDAFGFEPARFEDTDLRWLVDL
jgi:uncharacterized protein YbjT (DUF2867 family)